MRARLAGQVALLSATGTLAGGLLAGWVATSTADDLAGTTVRILVVTSVVVLTPYLLVRRRVLEDHRLALLLMGALGSALGCAANPLTWQGEAYFMAHFTRPGALSAVVDLAVWTLLGSIAAFLASRAAASLHQPLGYES